MEVMDRELKDKGIWGNESISDNDTDPLKYIQWYNQRMDYQWTNVSLRADILIGITERS